METLLYQALNSNELIINLVGENRLMPVFTNDISAPSLVYTFKPLKHNLANSMSMEITIIWTDYDLIQEIRKTLDSLLHFGYDSIFKPLGNCRFNSLNIGGKSTIYNSQFKRWEDTITYKITWKEV